MKLSAYHRMAAPAKRALTLERQREGLLMACPVCDVRTPPADLLAHLSERCAGPGEPGAAARRDRIWRALGLRRPRLLGSQVCDCGRRKERRAEACGQCRWLDGWDPAVSPVLGALRALGGAAHPEALVLETGLCLRQVQRGCAALLAAGRVRRWVDEPYVSMQALRKQRRNGGRVAPPERWEVPMWILRDRRVI